MTFVAISVATTGVVNRLSAAVCVCWWTAPLPRNHFIYRWLCAAEPSLAPSGQRVSRRRRFVLTPETPLLPLAGVLNWEMEAAGRMRTWNRIADQNRGATNLRRPGVSNRGEKPEGGARPRRRPPLA